MKKVQFRIDENQHDDLLDCLKTLYPDEPALTVAKGMKLLANALLKSKAGSKDINTFFAVSYTHLRAHETLYNLSRMPSSA